MSRDVATIESDPLVIQAELARLLQERRFAGAPQMSAFLRYIVRETLNGNAERIKAYSVGVDALGKPDSFDAQTDPSVRVLALRLRKTLAAIYEENSNPLAVIELKVGTYVPSFYKPARRAESSPGNSAASVDNCGAVVTAFERKGAVGVARQDRDDGAIPQHGHQDNDVSEVSSTGAAHTLINHSLQVAASDTCNERKSVDTDVSVGMIAGGSARVNTTYRRWLVGGAAILLVAAWQIVANKTDVQADTQGESPNVMIASLGTNVSGQGNLAAMPSSRPVVLVEKVSNVSNVERSITLMLTSRLVQSQSIDVIKVADPLSITQPRPGQYLLFVNGYSVDDATQFDMQIVSLSDGEMLYAKTLVLETPAGAFSSADVDVIDTLASSITDSHGPLYEDYCARYGHAELDYCKAG